jgi:hypothetical protein
MLPCTHVSWLRAHPGVSFHPGEIKIGGTYGAAGDLGIGTSPAHADLLRTLTMWDFADWTPPEASRTSRENSPSRNLQYFVNASVPPEGARTFGLWVRISRNPEWHHLLEPYKDWFRATLGPVRYAPDHRPLLQMCVNKSVQYITPRNPYGYHDGWARLDTAEGTAEFCDKLVPLLKAVNGQGVIIWGQQGTEPRGAEYRPDFDVLPPETATNWVTLQSRFREAGLKLGVATRPDSIPTRASWTHDTLVTLDPDDADHLEMLWRRFRNMMDKGCRLFYLDCFGMRVEDVAIMRFLRERMGPDVQTYSEMHCDAILPFTGLYMEAVYQGGTTPEDARFDIMWLGPGQWEMLRWLADDRISVAARPRTENAPAALPAGFHYRWMLERHLTPLEQPWALQPGAAVLRDLLPQWLDARGQWLK